MPQLGHRSHRRTTTTQGLRKALAVALSLLMVWQLFAYDLPVYADSIAQALERVADYRAHGLGQGRVLFDGGLAVAAEGNGDGASPASGTIRQAAQAVAGAPLASGSDVTLAAQADDAQALESVGGGGISD